MSAGSATVTTTRLNPLVIWGSGGQAKVLVEFLHRACYHTVAIFDNDPQAASPFRDIPIYHGEAGLEEWQSHYGGARPAAVVAIGSPGQARIEVQATLGRYGIRCIKAIHPAAVVAATASLANGCQVLANAVVATETVLGEQCIVNTSASVDHECVVGRGVHVAPGARVLGCVQIDDFAFIGAGAVVLSRLKVGRNALVGAGAVVTKNVPENAVVYGNPARVKRVTSGPARP